MTLNQIAEIANVSKSSVRNWITSLSENCSDPGKNCSDILAKIARARKTSKPADFTMEETVEIIRAGKKGTLASLLEDNARSQVSSTSFEQQYKKLLDILRSLEAKINIIMEESPSEKPKLLPSAIDSRLGRVENEVEKLEARVTTHPENFYTIAGYCNLHNMPVDLYTASGWGRRASLLTQRYGLKPYPVRDPRFGKVNAYPVGVLDLLFDRKTFTD